MSPRIRCGKFGVQPIREPRLESLNIAPSSLEAGILRVWTRTLTRLQSAVLIVTLHDPNKDSVGVVLWPTR